MSSAVAISAIFTIAVIAQDTNASKETLVAIADAYDGNRTSFGYGDIDFEYEDGYADTFERAKIGDMKETHVAKGHYIFNGQDALYTRVFPVEAMVGASVALSSDRVYSRLDSLRILTNGKKTLTERIAYTPSTSKVSRGHVIAAGSGDFFRYCELPLDLGRPESLRDDLAQNLRMVYDAKPRVSVLSFEENVIVDAIKTIRIKLKLPNGERSYWVDLERGAIPIRSLDEVVGGGRIERSNSKLTHIEGRGWLPMEMTRYLPGGRVKRVVLKQTLFNQVPPRDTFVLKLDEPTSIADTAAGRYYSARTVYNLNHLPEPSSSESRPLVQVAPSGSVVELPGEREHKPRYFYFISAVLLSGALCIIIVWRRFRAHR